MNSYPTYDISSMKAYQIANEMFNVDRFDQYVLNNPHVGSFHKHSFYHFVLFTEGSGHQIIDFENYPIEPNMMYFMTPNQSHKWFLEIPAKGYIINFSPSFLEKFGINSQILESFEFFRIFSQTQVFKLENSELSLVKMHFEDILKEFENKDKREKHAGLFIITHLLQILILASRSLSSETDIQVAPQKGRMWFAKYLKMVENEYKNLRLPKQYAEKLHLTTNHLNLICQTYGKVSAGEIIRKRVLLESKRLLVNFDKTIYEIAFELNFPDTSYFVKFFKKHTGLTPKEFRKQHSYEI